MTTRSIVLVAYEINAKLAKDNARKKSGLMSKLKRFDAREIVDHVAECWSELSSLISQQGAEFENTLLYTCKITEPLRIGKSKSEIVNNSFLMAMISETEYFGTSMVNDARYYSYSDNAEFEKKQFSILLNELTKQFDSQEVGIFGWINMESADVDVMLKHVASRFNQENDGELHFIEVTDTENIYPNFSDVASQKFEGKLAGNYGMVLKRSEYQSGIDRINKITQSVVRTEAIQSSFDKQLERNPSLEKEVSNVEKSSKIKKTYTDEFKLKVAEAALKPGATLASVGEQFDVSPTLVRNWKIKFLEEIEVVDQSREEKIGISVQLVQSWLQNSTAEGTIDSDGDLYVSIETTSEAIIDGSAKLYISGTQKLAAGGKNETSEISDQLTTNETNWLRSDFLKGVGSENTQFSYNLNCNVYGCAERVVVPLKLEKGKVSECPITAGQIGISELNFVFEDGDFRAEGTITGPNGFIYAAEVLTEEPEEGHVPAVSKTADDESSTEMYEFLWDVKKGDTVFVVLCAFEKLEGKLTCGFTGEAKVEEPISDDYGDDNDDFEEDKYSEYTEVVIDDEDNEQYYYWVLTDDEDEAVEAALKKHDEMGRPNAVNDEDAGVFPMAYQPVTEFGSESAVKIHVDGTDVSGIEDIFPFEDFKSETAIKFVKFIQSLSPGTFEKVEQYVTDGLDLIENNGDLNEAKDDSKLISIADEDGEPFENADAYLECLIQNITDEIEMYGLERPPNIDDDRSKNISDLTVQPIGSTEFKMEVASACAESGMDYKDFARLYNLNSDELNAWAVEFLGEGFA